MDGAHLRVPPHTPNCCHTPAIFLGVHQESLDLYVFQPLLFLLSFEIANSRWLLFKEIDEDLGVLGVIMMRKTLYFLHF